MYPNPTSENLTITLENNVALENVNFYNTLGQLVKTSNTTTTNISELAKGNYFVEVITKQGKATKTIVIK
ncbi:T9SS type A sorting domain-containing protein [Flavobacterium sp. PL11]|uniref:T9SS type A sorting domain-containing protein n=1 Tax=Flavobacterium sp. PL11 TaxID=3071717 RepID=UPI002E0EB2CA